MRTIFSVDYTLWRAPDAIVHGYCISKSSDREETGKIAMFRIDNRSCSLHICKRWNFKKKRVS